MERNQIIESLHRFIRQRPGLEFGNYGDLSNYRAEMRSITRDMHEAKRLLRAVELTSMSAETLLSGFRAYSGRLSISDSGKLDYCTGQYWPTEYRKAVCAVCAAALWDYYREDFASSARDGESAGNAIRRNFRRLFGRAIANRWFN